jgi:hypothetical protein
MIDFRRLIQSLDELAVKPLDNQHAGFVNVLHQITDVLRDFDKRLDRLDKPADGIVEPAVIISRLIALAIPADRYKFLNCVGEALDWLIENDRPGLILNASVRDLMDRRIAEQRRWRGA